MNTLPLLNLARNICGIISATAGVSAILTFILGGILTDSDDALDTLMSANLWAVTVLLVIVTFAAGFSRRAILNTMIEIQTPSHA